MELELCGAGEVLADVGAGALDLCRLAVRGGQFRRAVALERPPVARRLLAELGPDEPIEVRASDGLASLRPGEAERAVMAGFGDRAMAEVLLRQADRWTLLERAVLSPRGAPVAVRRALARIGMAVVAERLVAEADRPVWLIAVQPAGRPLPPPDPVQEELGLAAERVGCGVDPLLSRYLAARLGHLRRRAARDPEAARRLAALSLWQLGEAAEGGDGDG
jgi:tRNA A22 N-methylase